MWRLYFPVRFQVRIVLHRVASTDDMRLGESQPTHPFVLVRDAFS